MKAMGKTIVVTGSAGGIGGEVVAELLRRGASVIACDRNEAALKALKERLGSERLQAFALDITDRDKVAAFARAVAAKRQVDGLVNCAGVIQPFERVADTPYERMRFVFDVNFWGTVHMVEAFLPLLSARPEAHIVNVSSMGGFFPVPGQTMYGASKAAVRMLTEGLYAECLGTKVRVTVVIPGGVNTKIIENSGSAPNERMERIKKVIRLLSPKKAAAKIVRGMERNAFRVHIGLDAALLKAADVLVPRTAIALATRITSGVLFGER